ncbi:unnamed protein product [Larinioides sclopetarius]|uniref:Uncharacterized protein n=1 Tax=Larinioides sclopetarius TaxID=280406 RepID=A0AAV1ZQZ8_9ARAC
MESTGLGRRGHRINLADVLSKDFEPRVFNGSWVSEKTALVLKRHTTTLGNVFGSWHQEVLKEEKERIKSELGFEGEKVNSFGVVFERVKKGSRNGRSERYGKNERHRQFFGIVKSARWTVNAGLSEWQERK